MNVNVFISSKALERLKKDKTVKEFRKEFNKEILMIIASEGNRSWEKS